MSLTKVTYSMIVGAPVNVLDYGASPSATAATNTTAFQAALDTKLDVYIPAGQYSINNTLTVYGNRQRIYGEQETVLKYTLTTGTFILVTHDGLAPAHPYRSNGYVLNGITLEGSSTADSYAVQFNAASGGADIAHCGLQEVTIQNFHRGVMVNDNAYDVTLNRCQIYDCYLGYYVPIATNSAAELTITDSLIFACTIAVQIDNGATHLLVVNSATADSDTHYEVNAGFVAITNSLLEGQDDQFVHVPAAPVGGGTPFISFTNCTGIQHTPGANCFHAESATFLNFANCRFSRDSVDNTKYFVSMSSGGRFVGNSVQYINIGNSALVLPNNYWSLVPDSASVSTNFEVSTTGASNAAKFASNNTVTCTVTSTWYNLGVGTSSGLFAFRDATSGGTALFMADASAGATSVQNGITGFEMQYAGGQMQVRVTSGAAPRSIKWSLLQTNA